MSEIGGGEIMETIDINYKGILEYLMNNHEVPYSNPETDGLKPAEKDRMLEISKKGQEAVDEMKKIANRCNRLFGLEMCLPLSWLDGSNTKTRKNLWMQMKYSEYDSNPTSVSLFVENNNNETRYRISLEIKNDGIDKKLMRKYHSHLDMPKTDGMVYVSGSNEWGNPSIITDNVDLIKEKIETGEIRKVQICIYVEQEDGKTNEQYDAEIMGAVKKIIPYYNHVIGKVTDYDKNMILYGPPGTGKTYNTVIYAVAICDQLDFDYVKSIDYDQVMIRYRELLSEGRVAFTTFHQSYGYEEFIEGIKPVLDGDSNIGYTLEKGVFKKFCENARLLENNSLKCSGDLWMVRDRTGDTDIPFDYENYVYKNDVIMVETNDENDRNQCYMISRMKKGDWIVLGKDYKISAVGVIDDEEVSNINCEPFHWKRKVKWMASSLSASFSDIGIIGEPISNFAISKSQINVQKLYKLIKGEKKESKPHVFVIDEINRGNISKIFGELITLIEDTKREGMQEQASAVLPYSGELFSVPSNVYILGTMNTADRSIALMDTALRRRFQFVEMMPDVNVLRDIGADKVGDLDVAAMLEKINERITFLYDREHTIGHAFFTKLAKNPSIETLKAIFEKSVIPLLQEYFYEDYQKIQLVLGDSGKKDPLTKFILDEEVNIKKIFNGNVEDVVDLPDKKYTINPFAFDNLESYKHII